MKGIVAWSQSRERYFTPTVLELPWSGHSVDIVMFLKKLNDSGVSVREFRIVDIDEEPDPKPSN